MKEKVNLLTLCGCSKIIETTAGAREHICPILAQTIAFAETTEPCPEIRNERRLFRYRGKKTKDTNMRIFEETI